MEELWFGAHEANWGHPRRATLQRHLHQYVVVWPDRRLVDLCARLRAQQEKMGLRLGMANAWIAATALRRKCQLCTLDNDFRRIPGIRHFDWKRSLFS